MDRSTRTASIPEKDISSSSPPKPAVSSRRVFRSRSREGELASIDGGVFTCLGSIVSRVAPRAKARRLKMERLLDDYPQDTHFSVYAHCVPKDYAGTVRSIAANWSLERWDFM